MKFVNAAKYRFVLEPRYYFFGWTKTPLIIGSQSVLKALVKARKHLPKGHKFKIWDLQRPRAVQIAMLKSFERRLKLLHPRASKKKIMQLVYNFGAKPLKKITRLDGHRNGGAIDLTIVDRHGDELYMGTDHDDLTKKAATNFFEKIKNPSNLEREAKHNRRLLILAMSKAGFKNYAPEWWHWSYDK